MKKSLQLNGCIIDFDKLEMTSLGAMYIKYKGINIGCISSKSRVVYDSKENSTLYFKVVGRA